MKLRKIDGIMYRVKDLDASAVFYAGLGMKQVWRDDQYQMIGFAFPESDSEIVIHTDSAMPNPDINFLVDDVEAFVGEAKGKGIAVMQEPTNVRPGKFATIADPDGNPINVIDLTKFENKPKYD